MEYGKPQKLPDGRYFLKISGARHQVNGLVLQDAPSSKAVNFTVADPALFQNVDADLLAKAKESKLEWFGKELSDETINNAFQESVTDGVLGASLWTNKGEIVTTAFDTKANPVELADIKENTPCDVVFELSGLWFLKKSFGPIWRAIQIRVRSGPKFEPPKTYLFTDTIMDDQVETDPADLID